MLKLRLVSGEGVFVKWFLVKFFFGLIERFDLFVVE